MIHDSTDTVAGAEYVPVAINYKIETDAVLGPLPPNWEKGEMLDGGRKRNYFVNHKTKVTTWIDPRTSLLRKHNINDVVIGELPYGWEESYDEDFGIHYIDHTTQNNYADPPWNDEVRRSVTALKAKIKMEKRRSTIKEKEAANMEKIKEAERAIAALEAQRFRLDHLNVDDDDEAPLDVKDAEIDQKIAQLKRLTDKLENENKNLVNEVEVNAHELANLRQKIEAERAQRSALESYVNQLKQELSSSEEVKKMREEDERAAYQSAIEEAALPSIDDEDEVETLRARLALEEQERNRLRALTEDLLKEKEDKKELGRTYTAPAWVKEIDVHQRAKVLRQKIVNGGINPDELTFEEKKGRFGRQASNPKMPGGGGVAGGNDRAVKARETAFGKVDFDEEADAREFD